MTGKGWAADFELDQVIGELTSVVHELSPVSSVTEVRHEGWTKLELSTDDGAEYSFSIAVYHDLEDLQLAAEPSWTTDDLYFWHLPLERSGFADFSEMFDVLKNHLRRILRHPTRIRQKRGWMFWTFVCEVMEGEWTSLYRHAYLRGFFNVPSIEGRERVFRGPDSAPSE